ncbi:MULTISPECIES: gas vesicle structural protein GvpA [unclassified Streptomyces]|uniref:gas vesicle structural protein GvpA n=1 Tax=unclassified Streptomyces TaxID=2593676 RepID=UPI000DB90060|nr:MULTISPECIES: gas vesicle structural protein GvpA [unclassified Streptomyces]MYT68185.1 gas vesicle structural protein GvpA [Streptomyces sp. SID8367]RAJ72755.1 gas vesicle protein GvpA/GvpJ/GvpM family [Streptomyces sp. PsTaAH-137]
MSVVQQSSAPATAQGGGGGGTLYDVLELILDKGLVIDAFVRVSLVGIEILKVDVRIVVASVDTYLRFAEACNRLDLESGRKAPSQLTDLVGDMTEKGAKGKSKGALTGAVEAFADSFAKGNEPDAEEEPAPRPRKTSASRRPAPRRQED